ncbi:MAG: hypothetical protein SAK29_36905 [Scytonema sp. PMC 1069.18]|nr:hypothetical protein [Scytonema sp. PMC 1069.18]MEC4883698.1 hypothetical protein [Scytonema sp. PMC 1070.18]
MTQAKLNQILEQIETLEPDELRHLYQIIQTHLTTKEQAIQRTKFHQVLLTSGLVRQLKQPSSSRATERCLVQVQGNPVSKTIIEERR